MPRKRRIIENVLAVLDESEKWVIRIVSWNEFKPVLVKQSVYTDEESGERRVGKLKGFNADDFALLLEKSSEIEKLLNQKPKRKGRK